MSLRAGQEGHSIWCNSAFGPVFGGGGGCDLAISNGSNSKNSAVNLNNAYQCPSGQNENTFFTGNKNFLVTELEVFGFNN